MFVKGPQKYHNRDVDFVGRLVGNTFSLNAYEYIRMLQGRENASFMTAHRASDEQAG
jgi:hypothetical protein